MYCPTYLHIAHFDVEVELHRCSTPQMVIGVGDIFGKLQRFHPLRKKPPSVEFTKLKDFFYLLPTLPESLETLNFWSPTHPDPCQNYNIKPP